MVTDTAMGSVEVEYETTPGLSTLFQYTSGTDKIWFSVQRLISVRESVVDKAVG